MTNPLPLQARVVLSSIVTWLTFASFVLVLLSSQIGELFSGDQAEAIVTWITRIVGWIGGAVLIIRRVTPVAPEERGILPQMPVDS